jgi:tetratricopeptide (TPR) repeat protein
MPALSWQIIVVGDPLYRPCGIPIEQQIENARADAPDELPWLIQRKARLLGRQGRLEEALELCREVQSPIVDEEVAHLLSVAGRTEEAAAAWERAARARRGARDKARLELRRAAFLEENGMGEEALDILEDVVFRHREIVDARTILERMLELAAAQGDDGRRARIAEALAQFAGEGEGEEGSE